MIAISKDGAPWSELVQFTILWDGRFELYRFSDVTQYIEPGPEKVIEIDTKQTAIKRNTIMVIHINKFTFTENELTTNLYILNTFNNFHSNLFLLCLT